MLYTIRWLYQRALRDRYRIYNLPIAFPTLKDRRFVSRYASFGRQHVGQTMTTMNEQKRKRNSSRVPAVDTFRSYNYDISTAAFNTLSVVKR